MGPWHSRCRGSQQSPAREGGPFGVALTPDGRYLLFASTANNLLLNPNTNPAQGSILQMWNVFLRDRVIGSTTSVSVNYSGTGPGNGDSLPTGVSANGRYAVFESAASDLVAGDTNGVVDVFCATCEATSPSSSARTNGAVGLGALVIRWPCALLAPANW